MAINPAIAGKLELQSAGASSRHAVIIAFLFSSFVNLLMLTSPLYMLQVYDRVLASRSEATLLALSVLATLMFVIMGILDHARSRILARVGAWLQDRLDKRVLSASFRRLSVAPRDIAAHAAQRDLETVSRFWGSALLPALMDLPWAPLYLAALFVFHSWLGWFSIGAAVLLIGLTLWNQRETEAQVNEATLTALAADRQADNLKAESEIVRALGMTGHAFARWQGLRQKALSAGMVSADTSGTFSVTTKTIRLFMQSAILGLGAWLVLRNELSPGAMIAGSILMGRALQPIEVAISQWSVLTRSRASWHRLSQLLTEVPSESSRTQLPRPKGHIQVKSLAVIPPGDHQPVLRGVSFQLEPGQAMGVIGPSGSGKSSLARALTGVWRPASGQVRLDGASLDQYDPDVLGSYIGYLPQRVMLFDGTIAENIARLEGGADPQKIVAAAKKAAAHEMIVQLPLGYDTPVTTMGGQLSGGQIQRIGLARAFYGDPVLLILDEPNSNLDNDGSLALNHAIRLAKQSGCAVLIMAHRPAAIQECDLLLVLKEGMVQTLGPRDDVLRQAVKNAGEVARGIAPGAVSLGGVS